MARIHAVVGIGLGALSLLGCGSSKCEAPSPCTQPSTEVFVGSVDDTDAAIGILQSATGTTVFVCGGDDSFETFTHWFSTDETLQDSVDLMDGDWSISLSPDRHSILGSVTSPSDGEPHRFMASTVAGDPAAGIYEGSADCGRVGLIIQRENAQEQTAAQGTCLKRTDARLLIEQVNPVRPIKLNPNRSVMVELSSDPGHAFTLDPLAPPSAK